MKNNKNASQFAFSQENIAFLKSGKLSYTLMKQNKNICKLRELVDYYLLS